MSYDIHPDFKKLAGIHPPINRVSVPIIQRLMRLLYYRERSDAQVQVKRVTISGPEGNPLRAVLYLPVNAAGKKPGLAYFHGGGYVFPAASYQYELARMYTAQTGCVTLFVDYRLAPQHPFPAANLDCFAAYRWLLDQAAELGIDSTRVAVCGDSAGGALAFATCLMAQDEGLQMPCAQLLTYPSAGGDGNTESQRAFVDTPMCNSRDMDKYGRMFIQNPDAGPKAWRSALDTDSMTGLPMTYVETAEFDALRDAAQQLADRLTREGVCTELHNTKGTVHGYDMMLSSGIVQDCIKKRVAFLRRVFQTNTNDQEE